MNTTDDLRAALREVPAEGLDPDAVLGGAKRARARRRAAATGVVAAVAAVTVIATQLIGQGATNRPLPADPTTTRGTATPVATASASETPAPTLRACVGVMPKQFAPLVKPTRQGPKFPHGVSDASGPVVVPSNAVDEQAQTIKYWFMGKLRPFHADTNDLFADNWSIDGDRALVKLWRRADSASVFWLVDLATGQGRQVAVVARSDQLLNYGLVGDRWYWTTSASENSVVLHVADLNGKELWQRDMGFGDVILTPGGPVINAAAPQDESVILTPLDWDGRPRTMPTPDVNQLGMRVDGIAGDTWVLSNEGFAYLWRDGMAQPLQIGKVDEYTNETPRLVGPFVSLGVEDKLVDTRTGAHVVIDDIVPLESGAMFRMQDGAVHGGDIVAGADVPPITCR